MDPRFPSTLFLFLMFFTGCATKVDRGHDLGDAAPPDTQAGCVDPPVTSVQSYFGRVTLEHTFTEPVRLGQRPHDPEASAQVDLSGDDSEISLESRDCVAKGHLSFVENTQGEEIWEYEIEELRSTCALFVGNELVDFVVDDGWILWGPDQLSFEIAGQAVTSNAESHLVVRFQGED